MVEQKLVTGLNDNFNQFLEDVTEARDHFICAVNDAAVKDDQEFNYEAACQRFIQKIRRSVSELKEDDLYVISALGLIKK